MLRICIVVAFLAASTVSVAGQGLAVAQEQRAKNLFLQLRCVVCQNQSIAESDADVAKDLREVVREKMAQGRSNAEIKAFLVSRYGEYVLLKPSWGMHTMLLWLSPLLFLLLGFYWLLKSRAQTAPKIRHLSEDETTRIEELLKK